MKKSKKIIMSFLSSVMAMLLLGACSENKIQGQSFMSSSGSTQIDNASVVPGKTDSNEEQRAVKTGKTLVAYFSRVGDTAFGDGIDAVTSASLRAGDNNVSIGNTEVLANMIQKAVGSDIVQIQTVIPYPKDYIATRNRYKEELASGDKPALSTKIEDMDSYNIVYLGYPTWGMRLPPAVKSFLSEYNFSGKTIVPFNTNGGYGIGDTVNSIKEFCPNASVIDEAFSVRGKEAASSQDALYAWLREIGMLKEGSTNTSAQETIPTP
jgi:flavodoxin